MLLPPSPSLASSDEHRAATGSCRACPVRRYCALYAPHHASPPANCPFGPGPAAIRKAQLKPAGSS